MARADWQYIPTETLDKQKRDEDAAAWATQQRKALAQSWADAHLADFQQNLPQPTEPPPMPPGPFHDPHLEGLSGGPDDPGTSMQPAPQTQDGLHGTEAGPFDLSAKTAGRIEDQGPQVQAGEPSNDSPYPTSLGDAFKRGMDQGTGQAPDIPPLPTMPTGPFRPLPGMPNKPTQPPQETTDKILSDKPIDAQDFVSSLTKASMNQGTSPAFAEGMPGIKVGTSEEEAAARALGGAEKALGAEGPEATARGAYGANLPESLATGAAAIEKTNKMFAEAEGHAKIPPERRWDALMTALTRKLTDAGVDLSNLEKDAERVLGRPLSADEKASVQSRLNPFYTAKVAVDEGVRPALKGLSDEDATHVRNILTWKGNLDVSEAIGKRVEQDALAAAKPPTLTEVGMKPVKHPTGEQVLGAPVAPMVKVGESDAADAAVLGQEAAINRKFSGSLDAAESQAALDEVQRRLGPERYADLERRAQAIVDFNRAELQKDVDAGLVSPQQAQRWMEDYPNYTPVVIADYLKEQGRSISGTGRSLGVSANGVKSLTVEGTERARLDPIAASVDAAYQGEALRRRNASFRALYDLVQKTPAFADLFQVTKGGYDGATKYEKSVTGFINGEKYTITTPFEEVAQAIKQEGSAAIPGIGPAMQLYKELITGRNPTFLVGNAAIDAPLAILRTAALEGGAQNIPGVLVDLFKGYADAFKGITTGEYTGRRTRDYLAGGGGMGSYYAQTATSGKKQVEQMRRPSVFTISSPADAKRLLTDVLKLEPVKALGERVELGPRAMAYDRALKRGESATQAVLEGRTVTVDFAQGGSFAKLLNQVVPFLNPAIQGVAEGVRGVARNPKGALLTYGPALVGPALAIEAWNNATPERAKAYADVPDYIKDRGLVIMLPGTPPTDERGETRPQFAVVNLRQFAPIVMMVREGFNRVVGNDHRAAASLIGGAVQQTSPVQSLSSFVPPGVSTALELQQNRDFYRQATIATDRRDASASALSQGVAGLVNDTAAKAGSYPQVRPSQVDYATRSLTGGVGEMVHGASDIVAGRTKQSGTPQDIPGVGGFVRRIVRGDTGQQLQNARDERLASPIRQALHDAGLKPDVTVVGSNIGKIPLSRGEQAEYQRAANARVNEMLGEVVNDAEWKDAPPAVKAKIVQKVVDAAKKAAGGDVLGRLDDASLERRLTTKKAS